MTKAIGRGRIAFAFVGAAAAFYLVNRATAHTRDGLATGVPVTDIAPTFPDAITGKPYYLSFDSVDLVAGLAALLVVALVVAYFVAGRANTRRGEEQGSASWATPREIRPYRGRRVSAELRFTRTEGLSTDTYRTGRNLNALVVGASGTGKTRSYVIPNLLTLDASTVTTDPKGEIRRACAEDMRQRGYDVRSLDLIDLRASAQFSPMRYFNPEDPETSIAQLTECIIMNTTGADSRGDGFWERAERALLTALIAYVWATTPESDGQEPTLPAVLDLQKGIQGSEQNRDALTSETDLRFAAARTIVEQWRADPSAEDDPIVMQVLDFACRQYRTYEQGPVETRMSVVISLGVRLAPLDMHAVRRILTTDTIGIDSLGYDRTALFLLIPDSHTTFRFIAAMFWQSVFEQSIYMADHEESGRLPRMLHAFLDEFANIGRIPGFERVIATIRSRGISASVIVQTYSQGKALFRDDWDGIVGNCDSKLFLGGDDLSTTEWLSKVLGDETVVSNETSRSYGMQGSWSKNARIIRRQLMTPDEIGRLDNRFAILKIRGLKPFRSRKLTA